MVKSETFIQYSKHKGADQEHTDMDCIVSGDGIIPNTTSVRYTLPVHTPHYSKVVPMHDRGDPL